MRKGPYRTQDFHRATSDIERLYYSAGIPSSAWRPFSLAPRFKPFQLGETVIGATDQQKWYDKLTNDQPFDKPYFILLCGSEHDGPALSAAYNLMKLALKASKRVQVTDAASVYEEKVEDETVFMLCNVFDDCTQERLQAVRDWSRRHESCFRVISAAGSPEAFLPRLRLRPHAMLWMDSTKVSKRSLA